MIGFFCAIFLKPMTNTNEIIKRSPPRLNPVISLTTTPFPKICAYFREN